MARAVFNENQKRFLALWSEQGKDYPSITAFCQAHGFKNARVSNWRRHPEFKAAMDNPGVDLRELERLKALAHERWPSLPAWQGIWLEVYRQSRDRLTACEQVQKTWTEIEEEVEKSKRFQAGYSVIEHEIQVGIEDARKRAALAGKTSEINAYLEARRSPLAKSAGKGKGGDAAAERDPEAARKRYAEIMARHSGQKQAGEVTN